MTRKTAQPRTPAGRYTYSSKAEQDFDLTVNRFQSALNALDRLWDSMDYTKGDPGSRDQIIVEAELAITALGGQIAEEIDWRFDNASDAIGTEAAAWIHKDPDCSLPYAIERAKAVVRRLLTLEILGRYRDFGGESGVNIEYGSPEAVSLVNAAAQNFPSEWIEVDANCPAEPLVAYATDGRGSYEVRPVGLPNRPTGPASNGYSVVDAAVITVPSASHQGPDWAAQIATHELTHRFEHTNFQIPMLETAFLNRRCVDADGNPTPARPREGYPDEPVRDGGFIDEYIGRTHIGNKSEALAVGMEVLFHGLHADKIHEDPDYRGFLLGMLAVA